LTQKHQVILNTNDPQTPVLMGFSLCQETVDF